MSVMHASYKMTISMHLTCRLNDKPLPYGHHFGETKPAGVQVQRPQDEPSGARDGGVRGVDVREAWASDDLAAYHA